jgi:hypothetical protein
MNILNVLLVIVSLFSSVLTSTQNYGAFCVSNQTVRMTGTIDLYCSASRNETGENEFETKILIPPGLKFENAVVSDSIPGANSKIAVLPNMITWSGKVSNTGVGTQHIEVILVTLRGQYVGYHNISITTGQVVQNMPMIVRGERFFLPITGISNG